MPRTAVDRPVAARWCTERLPAVGLVAKFSAPEPAVAYLGCVATDWSRREKTDRIKLVLLEAATVVDRALLDRRIAHVLSTIGSGSP